MKTKEITTRTKKEKIVELFRDAFENDETIKSVNLNTGNGDFHYCVGDIYCKYIKGQQYICKKNEDGSVQWVEV